jgi:hypothetical protein
MAIMVKDRFVVSIPTPCSENWQDMTPAERGKFCSLCQKVVTDFSSMTDAGIIKIINQRNAQTMCGHFFIGQLDRALAEKAPVRKSPIAIFLSKVAALLLLLQSFATTGSAQTRKEKTHQSPHTPGTKKGRHNPKYGASEHTIKKTQPVLEMPETILGIMAINPVVPDTSKNGKQPHKAASEQK